MARFRVGQFVEFTAWDHWEEFDDENHIHSGSCDAYEATFRTAPFIIRGQVIWVTSTHVGVEGTWEWVDVNCTDPISCGKFGIVISAIVASKPLP